MITRMSHNELIRKSLLCKDEQLFKPVEEEIEEVNTLFRKIKKVSITKIFALTLLEKKSVLIHFSFENKSKFYDIEKDVKFRINALPDRFRIRVLFDSSKYQNSYDKRSGKIIPDWLVATCIDQ